MFLFLLRTWPHGDLEHLKTLMLFTKLMSHYFNTFLCKPFLWQLMILPTKTFYYTPNEWTHGLNLWYSCLHVLILAQIGKIWWIEKKKTYRSSFLCNRRSVINLKGIMCNEVMLRWRIYAEWSSRTLNQILISLHSKFIYFQQNKILLSCTTQHVYVFFFYSLYTIIYTWGKIKK